MPTQMKKSQRETLRKNVTLNISPITWKFFVSIADIYETSNHELLEEILFHALSKYSYERCFLLNYHLEKKARRLKRDIYPKIREAIQRMKELEHANTD